MPELPDECIDMVMTSPPYWGLRDYGEDVREIWGGDKDCEHNWTAVPIGGRNKRPEDDDPKFARELSNPRGKSSFCQFCGAWHGQLGLEPTFQLYLDHMMIVCAEIRRVLKKTGSFWLNMGDTYSATRWSSTPSTTGKSKPCSDVVLEKQISLPSKCLLGIPSRLRNRLVDEQGWICRNTIIWHKPNAMPSSVKDRCSNSYEFLFHLVKAKKYYYDLDAIREAYTKPLDRWGGDKLVAKGKANWDEGTGQNTYRDRDMRPNKAGKNPGDVLIIPDKYKLKQNILSEQLAYIAGIIDGEGSIILRRKPKQNELFMVVVNTNKNVIKWLHEVTKVGTIKQREMRNIKWRRVWEWNTAAQDTTRVLWAVYPYLIIKREHAKIAIEYQSLAKHGGGPNRYTPAEKERRKELVIELGELNQGNRIKTTAPEPGKPTVIGVPLDLWRIPTQPRPEAHFATFPDKLCIKPILATCPSEICKKCGKARVRITRKGILVRAGKGHISYGYKGGSKHQITEKSAVSSWSQNFVKNGLIPGMAYEQETIGWTDCGCKAGWNSGVLLDPFAGRGTALIMAKKLGRHYVGYELKKEYCEKLIKPTLEEIDPLFDYKKPSGAASAL